jgi:murein DD-endopeptidase MepM/ murein hydrolase activator NlpD
VSTATPAEPGLASEPTPRSREIALRRGDTLVLVLAREGLAARDAHEVALALSRAGVDLRRLRARHRLEITRAEDGDLLEVAYAPSPWTTLAAITTGRGWTVTRRETEPEVRVEAVQGSVRRSLFEAIEAAGESAQLVLDLVQIFESDFDFTADPREGDRFRLLVEKRYADGRFVEYGRVLAAQYRSEDGVLTGIGWGAGRFAHYDPEGRSLRKTFLKSPLEFTRITSGFTYARPHPILGGVRPHLAIDYGAPMGTPVRAVADALVLHAGWNGGNGIQVRLRHRAGYETYYNHLSRVAPGVRRGARVSQRQVIGYVGSTGLSTGPHLDYRVAKQGRFVNPLSEKFLPGDPIPAGERARFRAEARGLVERLDRDAPF